MIESCRTNAAQVLASATRLPTISSVAIQLAAVVRHPSAGAAEIERVVRADPTLAAELLRIANSAAFYAPREVKSIRQAVTLLGTKRLFDVAATAAFSRTIPSVLPGYGIAAVDFFSHSAAVAVLSERLAREVGKRVTDMVFAAGLLHDLGKLALGRWVDQAKLTLGEELRRPETDIIEAERSVLGTDHAEVGALLAQKWKLPVEAEHAAAFHHSPSSGPPDAGTVVALVHTADALAHLLGFGGGTSGLSRRIDPYAVKRLGIEQKRLEAMAADTMGPIEDLTRMFQASADG